MWDALVDFMLNALLWLYQLLGNNFVLSIGLFTVLIRLVTMPFSMRQQRTSMKMQVLQPQIQAIQKKFKDNPAKMQEELLKIGYNPAEQLMGCLPMLLQLPILIGLYQAILLALGATPLSLFLLSQRIYPFIDLSHLLPLDNTFLWLNLAKPDPWYILPVLVYVSSFARFCRGQTSPNNQPLQHANKARQNPIH